MYNQYLYQHNIFIIIISSFYYPYYYFIFITATVNTDQVKGAKVEEAHELAMTENRTSVYLACMSGLVTTNNMMWATPTVAKRIFGPHMGSILKSNFPDLSLPRIYRKRKKDDQNEKDKNICKISGKLLKSASFHDPGRI